MTVSRAIALSVVALSILALRGGALRAMPRVGSPPGADPGPHGSPLRPTSAGATSLRTFRRIGQFGGRSYSVDAVGNVALLGVGSHADLLDLAVPEPVKVGTFEVAGTVIDVALSGDRAFVLEGAPGGNRLHVVGVSSSGPLVEVAQLGVGDIWTFELADNLIFTGGPRGLGVIDVAGGEPVARGTVPATGSLEHLRVGPRLVVASGGEEVSVLLRDGGAVPRLVSQWALPPGDGEAWSIVDVATGPTPADQSRALVLAYRYLDWPKGSGPRAREAGPGSPRPAFPTEVALVVLDLGDPAAPVEEGRLDLGAGAGVEFPQALAVVPGRAFVAASYYAGPRAPFGVSGTILEVDLTEPTAPLLVDDEVRFLAPSHDMTVAGSRVLLAQSSGGLEVVDVTTPGYVVSAASYATPYQPRALAASEGTVFLGDYGRDGVWLIDAADASDPTAAAHLDDLSLCWADCSAALFGTTAVLADFNFGLQLFDVVGDRLAHRAALEGTRRAISMSGPPERLVLTAHPDGSRVPGQLLIVDVVASPPEILASETITPYVGRAAAVDGRAYVLTGAGMAVVDTSHPSGPRIVGNTSVGGTRWRIAARENTVYLVEDDGTVHVLDAADPAAPREVGWLDKARQDDLRPNSVTKVALAGDVLFVLHTGWLQAVAVRDLEHPREIGWVSEEALGLAGSLVSLAMDEGALYVASSDGGIAIVRFGAVESVSVLLLPSLAR